MQILLVKKNKTKNKTKKNTIYPNEELMRQLKNKWFKPGYNLTKKQNTKE